jgi:ribosomal protein L40E
MDHSDLLASYSVQSILVQEELDGPCLLNLISSSGPCVTNSSKMPRSKQTKRKAEHKEHEGEKKRKHVVTCEKCPNPSRKGQTLCKNCSSKQSHLTCPKCGGNRRKDWTLCKPCGKEHPDEQKQAVRPQAPTSVCQRCQHQSPKGWAICRRCEEQHPDEQKQVEVGICQTFL